MPKIISFPDVPGKEFEVGDDFTESDIEELYAEERPSSSAFRRAVGDTAVALAKGVVALPQSIAGLADIVGGITGAGSLSKAIEPVVDFKTTQDILGGLYSHEAQRAQRRVAAAEGIVDTLKTVLKNPSMIQQVAGESLPSMLGGGAAAGRLATAGVARGVAAGIGEGAITAGSQAQQIREATPEGELDRGQAATAAVSGLLTAAVGTFGNKIAGKLGVQDIDLLTSPKTSEAVKRGIMARAVGGAIIEGGEELLQSTQEQIAANVATGKPWDEGLEQAGVLGAIVGAGMGGVAGAVQRRGAPPTEQPQPAEPTPETPTQDQTTETGESVDEIERGIAEALSEDKSEFSAELPVSELPSSGLQTDKPMVFGGAVIGQGEAPAQQIEEVTPPVPAEPNLLPLTTKVLEEQTRQLPEVPPAPEVEVVPPPTETVVEEPQLTTPSQELKIGDDITIMSVPSVLADTASVGGVRFDIFNGARLKDKRSAVRVMDEESGRVVQLTQYPDYDSAEKAYKEVVAKAQQLEKGPQDALQEQSADAGVLREARQELGLPGVVPQDTQQEVAPKEGAKEEVGQSLLDLLGAKHDMTLQQAEMVVSAFNKLPENSNPEALQKEYLRLALPADIPSEVGLGKVASIAGAKEVLNDLRKASAGVKELGVRNLEKGKRTSLGTPPSKKLEKGASETPAQAAQKIETEVKAVARTEGQPLRASDKSVRDLPVTGSVKGDVITFSVRRGPKFTFNVSEISQLTEWDRKQLIEKRTRHWDDEPGGAGQAERLRDSVRSVMRKLVTPKPSLQDRIDANRKLQKPSSIDQKISELEAKIKPPGDTSLAVIIPGLDPATARAVYNTALRIAIGVLKATRNIQRASQAAIKHIRSKAALSAADEDRVRQDIEGEVAYQHGVLARAALNIARGFSLPKAMVESRRQKLDLQRFIETSLKLKADDVRAAINTEFKTKADQDAATQRLSDFLNGTAPVSTVGGPEVQRAAEAVRKAIDDLSLLAVNKGMVTGDMATTWLGNMGQWLKRTYLAFDPTSDWNYDTLKRRKDKGDEEITRIWNDAKAFLQNENPSWDAARIEAEMRSLIDRVSIEDILGISGPKPAGQGPRFSTEISSLLKRKDIPREIREWMGEIKDPYAKVLQSGKWLAQFITRNLAQREIARIGLETGVLSETKSGRYTEQLFPPEPKFVPQIDPTTGDPAVDASGQPIGQWVTQVDRRHEPLSGYWTTPELASSLREFDERLNNMIGMLNFGTVVGKAILTGTAYQKGALVGWNPASYGVNIIGGGVMRLATGALNPIHLGRALNAVAFGEKPINATSTRRALKTRADYLLAVKAGATGKGILLGDIDANLHGPREADAGKRALQALRGILSDPKAGGNWTRLRRSINDLWRIPGDYGIKFMDDVFRVSAFFDELSLAKKAFPGMNQDEQVRWAADRALNIYQNYDRLPKVLRDASRVGALNTFVSFKAEMFRNAYWIARYAKEGLQSRNPALIKDGAQKLAGLIAMSALPFVVSALSKSKHDVDDEEDEAMKRWIVPPWDRSEELVYMKVKDGKYTYIPMGYLLPTFEYARPVTTILNAANDPNPDEATLKALSGWASDYLGPGAFLGPIFEAGFNKRLGTDRKITLKRGMEALKERSGYVAESFVPRGIRMLEEAYKAYNKIPGDFGREYSFEEMGAKLAGLRERTVDVKKAAPYVLGALGNRWRDASSEENLQARKHPAGSPEALEAQRYEAETKAHIKTLYKQAISDLQTLGVSHNELVRIAIDRDIPVALRQ